MRHRQGGRGPSARVGISCHVDHLGRLLRSLGWTPQRPPRRAPVLI
ncbi:MAG: winged helix-turn-helix domain-containing protein [Candidatus Binataceae bacterium]